MTTSTMEKIKVMLAFDEGKKIEYRLKGHSDWSQCRSPIWEWSTTDYRVAPPAPRKFTRWFLEDSYGNFHSNYSTKEGAENINRHLIPHRKVVAFEMTEIPNAS